MTTRMSPQRFLERFRAFKGQEQQGPGVLLLHQAISQLPGSEAIFSEEAPWAVAFSSKPSSAVDRPESPKAAAKAMPPLDPRGSEEAYDHTGRLLWKVPALARGQRADSEWRHTGTDTPPGLYRVGTAHRDYEQVGASPPRDATLQAYGWYSFDMVELEGQEKTGAWAAQQKLLPTLGCIRVHNIVLRDKVLPHYEQGTVYVGVFQEKP
ncbi:MAG: L,D-transpeptidase [Prochlorococcaceae cyanobacterium]